MREINEKGINSLETEISISEYPILSDYSVPDISADAGLIMDAETRTVLFAKNEKLRFSMASVAKIMTSLVGLESFKPETILTVFNPVVEGSRMGFREGDKFTFRDMLVAMMLPSSNEAAYAIAENYPGGLDLFVNRMNEKAKEMNLINTHFSDPAGLDDDNNYSTVYDLAQLAGYALKNDTLAEIFATKNEVIFEKEKGRKFSFVNLNKLLGIEGVNGVKTGTTEGAGEVLVTSKTDNGRTYIVVVMKSKQRFVDTQELLALLSDNLKFIKPEYPGFLTNKPDF